MKVRLVALAIVALTAGPAPAPGFVTFRGALCMSAAGAFEGGTVYASACNFPVVDLAGASSGGSSGASVRIITDDGEEFASGAVFRLVVDPTMTVATFDMTAPSEVHPGAMVTARLVLDGKGAPEAWATPYVSRGYSYLRATAQRSADIRTGVSSITSTGPIRGGAITTSHEGFVGYGTKPEVWL